MTARGQVTLRMVALGIAFALLVAIALVADKVTRWNVVSLALLGVGFGISLAQWLEQRRRS
jgi:hypothetical protein